MELRTAQIDLWRETKRYAVKKLLREYHYDTIQEDMQWIERWIPSEKIKNFTEYVERRGKARYNCAMFTVNFKPDIEMDEIIKKTEKCCKKIWITNYVYCYETRGLDENGDFKGIHMHIATKISEKKRCYECLREVRNTFKNCVGNPLHVNVRYNNNFEKFEKYVKGLKNGKPKEHSVEDKKFRKYYDLKEYYAPG